MNKPLRSRIVKIGNSRGIRIPRAIIEQVGLTDEVEMFVEGNKLIIRALRSPRQGWTVHFASMTEHGDDRLPDEITPTQWDEEEWTW